MNKPAFGKYDLEEGFNFQTTQIVLSWENKKILANFK